MSLPVSANTTCDIYRAGSVPGIAPPDVAGVPCFLKCDWRSAQEAGDRNVSALTWTHIMLVAVTVDIRDGYTGSEGHMAQDSVYIPDQHGTPFNVTFVERAQRGTAHEHKRVYLDRQTPLWPTNEL